MSRDKKNILIKNNNKKINYQINWDDYLNKISSNKKNIDQI
jgi:hypothetical protein